MDRPTVRVYEERMGASVAWRRPIADLHLPRARLPLALAQLHKAMEVGAALDLQVMAGDHEGEDLPSDEADATFFAAWQPYALADVLVGAGFEIDAVEVPADQTDVVRARAKRGRTLADTVGPGMRLLVCGLNPSIYAADVGIGYARPGNRFWPAALAAGLVSRTHDPVHALAADGVGMTDLVKRATRRAGELSGEEYRAGVARVERLVRWLEPEAVCFIGLAGWRAAVDRGAVPGWQASPFAGRHAYVMPSTSGLNARTTLTELAAHLAAAGALPRG